MARYPEILAGNRITAQLLDSMLPDEVAKTATQGVTSSTTLVDDAELFVAVEASATYHVELFLLHDSDPAGDFKLGWTAPSGATMTWGGHAAGAAETSSAAATTVNMRTRLISETEGGLGGADGGGTTAFYQGYLITSTTAGNLQFQFAQQTSNAQASNCRAGSILRVRRLT